MRKLKFIPTLITIPALIILIYLGTWQLKRLIWKQELIQNIETNINMPSVELSPAMLNSKDLLYRNVTLHGKFLNHQEIHLYGGGRYGQSKDGYLIFTPFQLNNGSYIMVNRGWVPIDYKNNIERHNKGISTISGNIMPPEEKQWLIPDNNLNKNIWFWIDLSAMQSYINHKTPNFYIMQNSPASAIGQYPIIRNLNPRMRNDHLQYAITWYLTALCLLVIFILYHKKPKA